MFTFITGRAPGFSELNTAHTFETLSEASRAQLEALERGEVVSGIAQY